MSELLDGSPPPAAPNPAAVVKQPTRPKLRDVLGPGLITGASDDDPSGIATYWQVGAQFGYQFGWTMLFSWPLMCAIQEISARVGRERPGARPLARAPDQAAAAFARIRLDTRPGMALSNAVALFIMITAAATLHAAGQTDIQTSAQAAEALRPLAGPLVFVVVAVGIIGTGLLALPVLASSAAYAVGEAFGWHVGLARKARRAKAFYATIAIATLVGATLNFTPLDPIKALFWSAVINGIIAAPVMAMTVHMASNKGVMGAFALPRGLKAFGWVGVAVMAAAAIGLFATWGHGG